MPRCCVGRPGQKYILGGENLSFRELFGLIGQAVGRQYKLREIPVFLIKLYARLEKVKAEWFGISPNLMPEFAAKYSRDYRLSSDKAIREIGYRSTPIRVAIQQTLTELQ